MSITISVVTARITDSASHVSGQSGCLLTKPENKTIFLINFTDIVDVMTQVLYILVCKSPNMTMDTQS